MSSGHLESEKKQPTSADRKIAVLRFPGPIVTFRGFKQALSRRLRTTSCSEFEGAVRELAEVGYGQVVSFRPPRSSKETVFFIKCKPEGVPSNANVISIEEYGARYHIDTHCSVTSGMRDGLIQKGFVDKDFFLSKNI